MKDVDREWLRAQYRDAKSWRKQLKRYLWKNYIFEGGYYLMSAAQVGSAWFAIMQPDSTFSGQILMLLATLFVSVITYVGVGHTLEWRRDLKESIEVESFKIRLWTQHGEQSQEEFMNQIRSVYYFQHGLNEQETDARLQDYVDLIDRQYADFTNGKEST